LFNTLTFNNYENSLNDIVTRISLKRDVGMIPRHYETQAKTHGDVQATTYGVVQTMTLDNEH